MDEINLTGAPPVIQRIEAVMNYFLGQMAEDDSAKTKRYRRMLAMIATEGLDEIVDAPPEAIEYYFTRAASLMMWAATGERVINLPWPTNFTPPDGLQTATVATELETGERREIA